MTIEHIDATHPDETVITHAAAVVAAGAVVAYPTDTFYALGADPRRSDGVSAIFAIKGRREGEALPLIAGSLAEIERLLGPLGETARRLAQRFWPGPLTLVVPLARGVLDPRVNAGHRSIAVRVPDHASARALASAAGGLITSTSANRSGAPPAATADDVVRSFPDASLIVLDGGPTPGGLASTIVDVREQPPRLVRAGQVPFDRVLESLQ
jgi:L-threonylcarbamoyladenylate synthase